MQFCREGEILTLCNKRVLLKYTTGSVDSGSKKFAGCVFDEQEDGVVLVEK